MNVYTGDVKPFDQLSEAEKRSGEWMPLSRDQLKSLEAGKTTREQVRRELLAAINPESGLPVDAKPQAHRRAIALKGHEQKIVDEIMGTSSSIIQLPPLDLPRAQIDEPSEGDVLAAIGGVASVAQ
jgi:hypothetical protein